jgi:hypothetical protein
LKWQSTRNFGGITESSGELSNLRVNNPDNLATEIPTEGRAETDFFLQNFGRKIITVYMNEVQSWKKKITQLLQATTDR